MGHIADPASVHDGSLFLFSQKPVELGVVARGDDHGVKGPPEAVNLYISILDDPQIDLYEVFFIFENLITEMDAPARYTCQSSSSQIKAVGVVRVSDVEESLDGFFAQQIRCRGGDLVLGGVFAGDGTEAFAQGDTFDLKKIHEIFAVSIA